ncbi:hypothetical protein GCM10010862_29530 [Devosia nitrariae]|uniref:Uncharacterized protein n=1 Tax=Devosia nitrariae TaxID=2071872 RepID=A0ABQ5W7D4_9HYPH|nr:hypothetical protein [Devosia nitrariae]GLQ55694.1 hypothetical protein GCM10010862_29530 [Devosia nitrariae]
MLRPGPRVEDLFQRLVGEQLIENAALGLCAGEDHLLLDFDDGRALRGSLDAQGIVEEILGEVGRYWGHGGREQHGLAPGTDALGDGLDRSDEAHVEHAVGLVEDQEAGFVEPHLAVIDKILEPSGSGHHHVDALGDLLDLRMAGNAAEN